MQVSFLPEPEKHPLWPGIRELLRPAAEYGDAPIFCDDELLWIAHEGGVVFAAGTTLLWNDGEAEIRLCGGARHREWVTEALRVVESWARAAGAVKLTMRGRKGWARYCRAFGWALSGTDEENRTMFEKELVDGQ
jgi:hypothetical protein